ncbi:MAG: universal stress protein [Thermoproteota archaeon]|nr:universal stress protein [Thermoproteota archaeon]
MIETIYSKILVPYDGSKHAEKALNKAVNLAKLIKGSEMIILNVIEEILTPPLVFPTRIRHYKTGEDTTLSTYFRDLQTDMRYKMINTLEKIKQKYENTVKIRTVVLVGSAEDKIVGYANRQNVDLIVMGSKGLKGISRLLMGSVSRHVSEKVKCSVMIVR